MAAFPKSQAAFGTDISGKFSISSMTAVSTLKFILVIFHVLFLSSFNLE
jgi:hypothetical protein